MNATALRSYLYDHIPLSRAMGVEVLEASAAVVVLEAPLAPNLNMHGTMFGGSAATLGLTAAWSVVHLRLEAEGISHQLVIHRTEMEYLRPIKGTARAVASFEADWESFQRAFGRGGRGRLTVTSEVLFDEQIAARLVGEFVAIAET